MAAVGAEVTGSWFLSSGGVGFLLLLLFLLSIVLTALCSDCGRRSFELQEPVFDRNPPSLIRVVKLEEAAGARENPMIEEIQSDEIQSGERETSVSFTPWRSHLGVTQTTTDVQTNGSTAAAEPEAEAGDSNHIYHVIGGGRSSSSSGGGDADVSSISTSQEPGEVHGPRSEADFSERDRNSMYAQISKKKRVTTPTTAHTPEEEQVEQEEESPPLPDRRMQLE